MRIESPVGCPTAAGEPAEEKAARDGAGGLFTNIMDCFRVLLSGSASGDGAECGQMPAAAGKPSDRGQGGQADASLLPTLPEMAATRLAGARADEPVSPKGRAEVLETSAGRVPLASAGASFQLVVPELVANGQAGSGTVDPAVRQTNAKGREAFTINVSGSPVDASQQPGIPGFAMDLQDSMPGGEAVTRDNAAEGVEDPDASAAGTSGPGFDSRNGEQGYEVANPQVSLSASIQTQLAVAVQATAPALMMGAQVVQADGSSSSVANTQVPSSFSAPSTPGVPRNEGVEPKVTFPAVSSTPWMPRRVGNAMRTDLGQGRGGALRHEAAPEATAAPDGSSAYTKATRTADGIGPDADPNIEGLLAGSQSMVQRLPDKVLSAAPGQPANRQESSSHADSRPGIPEAKADDRLPSQTDAAARPAGASKTGAAVDAAALAMESEKVLAGRGRLRTINEGGALEGSAISSPSGLARDAQGSPQAATAVKDAKAPAFMFEVAERISSVVAGARGEVTIQLKPDQFGRRNIVAESGASGILARITTESASLKLYLESNLPALQQALQEQGLRVERIDVMVQEGLSQHQSASQWQQSFGHAPGGHEGGRNARFAAPALDEPAEPANEITLDAAILGALHPHSTFHTVA